MSHVINKTAIEGLKPFEHPPTLTPGQLSAQAHAAAAALLDEGRSDNTVRSYRSAMNYWAGWFGVRYQTDLTLPVPAEAVLQFVVDHLEHHGDGVLRCGLPAALDAVLVEAGFKGKPGPLALETVNHRLSVLAKAHTVRQDPNPVDDPRVRELMASVRRAYAKRGVRQKKAAALHADPLSALLATCGDDLKGLRDRALLLVGFASGGRRRSELVSLQVEDLQRVSGGFMFTLGQSKTNQSGAARPEDAKPVMGQAAQALESWLSAAQIQSGAVFRRVRKGGLVGEALSDAAVNAMIKDRAQLAGLEGRFTAHSLRSGFVTEAGLQNVPPQEGMALTGHHSLSTYMAYYRAGAVVTSKVADLLGNKV